MPMQEKLFGPKRGKSIPNLANKPSKLSFIFTNNATPKILQIILCQKMQGLGPNGALKSC